MSKTSKLKSIGRSVLTGGSHINLMWTRGLGHSHEQCYTHTMRITNLIPSDTYKRLMPIPRPILIPHPHAHAQSSRPIPMSHPQALSLCSIPLPIAMHHPILYTSCPNPIAILIPTQPLSTLVPDMSHPHAPFSFSSPYSSKPHAYSCYLIPATCSSLYLQLSNYLKKFVLTSKKKPSKKAL